MTDTSKPSPHSTDGEDGGKLADKPVLRKRGRNNTAIVTAAATGIGSAALLAALLYANRSRKKKPDPE